MPAIPLSALRDLADTRPVAFVVGLFLLQLVVPLPFVIVFKLAGLDFVALQLIIPIVESAVAIWVVWYLAETLRRIGTAESVSSLYLD